MSMMINVVYHDHHERCPECKALDTLELYDKYNRMCNYRNILDTHDLSDLKNKSVRYFKCNNCKNTFKIDWSGCVPIPLKETKINDFINQCKELGRK